jgi:hypothetical protein
LAGVRSDPSARHPLAGRDRGDGRSGPARQLTSLARGLLLPSSP